MVRAYSTSGGSFIVAKENLGDFAGVLTASALMIDYTLTVAVSVSAGVLAITSVANGLSGATVEIAVLFVVVIALANLRGARESGRVFAVPAYGFILLMGVTILAGLGTCAVSGCPQATVPDPVPPGTDALTIFLILKAFSSGASALTGIEAIANGVSAFERPQAQNAARTLGVLAAIAVFLFLGVSWLAVHLHAAPSESASVLSQIARAVFPEGSWSGFLYYGVQAVTVAILVLAANTSFQGFPRLLATLAGERFAARQFRHLGNRLAYSNGILVLALLAIALLVAFKANTQDLVHLYVLGVFTAFTLAQLGMVRHWRRHREGRWRRSAAINAVGAALTGLVTVIVVLTKFTSGAWMVVVLMPLLMALLFWVRRHYRRTRDALVAGLEDELRAEPAVTRVVLHESGTEAARRYARWYADRIAAGNGTAGEPDFETVLIPEALERRSLRTELGTNLRLKRRLLDQPGIAIADVPLRLGPGEDTAKLPERLVCRVLFPEMHAASMRSLRYARALGIEDTRAVFVAFDDERAAKIRREWEEHAIAEPLEQVEAPTRDLGGALTSYVRELTGDGETAVAVVMHDLRIHGPARTLHNEDAVYIKRMLLFEPRVIVTTVPYRLG